MPGVVDPRAAIAQYFSAERAELVALVVVSAAMVAGAVALALSRDRFARGLAAVLVVTAVLFASVAVPLLLRDARHRADLDRQLASGGSGAVVAAESARIAEVLRRYPAYRWAYVAMLASAAIIALSTRAGLANGIAVGLLVLAATGLVVDHYSEERARTYHAALAPAARDAAR